jgi:hypothetical protein
LQQGRINDRSTEKMSAEKMSAEKKEELKVGILE